MVENPVPSLSALLILAIPGIALLGWSVSRLTIRDDSLPRYLAPAVAVSIWVLVLHVSGRLTGSFHSALWAGTIPLAVLGHFLHARTLRTQKTKRDKVPTKGLWLSALIAVAIVSPIAVGWAFHDEVLFTGHMSMSAAIQNGPYPPRSLSLPTYELRYHYAFPLLVATITSIFRMPLTLGIDILTILAGGYFAMLLWLLGERLLGTGRGWLTVLITFLGGGAPFVCSGNSDELVVSMLGYCAIEGVSMNPPLLSYLFQHPWSIGLPVTVATMIVTLDDGPSVRRLPLIGALLIMLSFSQIALFAAMSATLVVSESLSRGLDLRRGCAMLGVVAASLLITAQLGGFFADAPADAMSLKFTLGIVSGVIPSYAWNIATFGLLLPLGIIGIVRADKLRVMLACLALGGLLVINTISYTRSWDIAKFAAVAVLGLSVGASVLFRDLLYGQRQWMKRALTVAALAGIVGGGMSFATVFLVNMEGIPPDTFHKRPSAYTYAEAQAMSWLRKQAKPAEIVFRNSGNVMSFSQYAGLPQVWYDPMLEPFGGAPTGFTERRDTLVSTMPDDPEAFASEGVVWFVIEPNGSRVAKVTEDWVNRKLASERARFGSLRVIRLNPELDRHLPIVSQHNQ